MAKDEFLKGRFYNTPTAALSIFFEMFFKARYTIENRFVWRQQRPDFDVFGGVKLAETRPILFINPTLETSPVWMMT